MFDRLYRENYFCLARSFICIMQCLIHSLIFVAETKSSDNASVVMANTPKEDVAQGQEVSEATEPADPPSESEPSSEDDYVAESEKPVKGAKSSIGKVLIPEHAASVYLYSSISSVLSGVCLSRRNPVPMVTPSGAVDHTASAHRLKVLSLAKIQCLHVPAAI